MQPDDIKALPVAQLAADSCALFLWATSPKLPLALEVMAAWGFDYKTVAFVWAKRNKLAASYFTGMGFYTRQNAEFVLLGLRGSLQRLDNAVHQIIDAPISVHSRKPAEVRGRIDRLFAGDKIELFARCHTPGWDVWGLDVSPDVPASSYDSACAVDPFVLG